MPKTAALNALLKAYREKIFWLLDKAKENERNPLVAQDYMPAIS